MAMTLVSTTTVGSGGAASIEFTNIPQTGKDLLVLLSGRGVKSLAYAEVHLQINGTTSGYSFRALQGSGSSTLSFSTDGISDKVRLGLMSGSGSTSNTFGSFSVYLPNYTTSNNKGFSSDAVSENNATEAYQEIIAGSSGVTAAITSLTLLPLGGNFVQHSTASLYIIS